MLRCQITVALHGVSRRPPAHTCKPLFFYSFFLKEEEHGATAWRSTWWWKRTLLTSLTIFSIMFCAWNSACVPKYMSAHHHIWKAQFTREKIISQIGVAVLLCGTTHACIAYPDCIVGGHCSSQASKGPRSSCYYCLSPLNVSVCKRVLMVLVCTHSVYTVSTTHWQRQRTLTTIVTRRYEPWRCAPSNTLQHTSWFQFLIKFSS